MGGGRASFLKSWERGILGNEEQCCQGLLVRGKDGTLTSLLLHIRKETLTELCLAKRITFDNVIYQKGVWKWILFHPASQ